MGEFLVEGPDAVSFVDYLITNDLKNSQNLKAVYSPLCREDGTVIDDLIAYKLGSEKVLICVNASNIEKDWNWMQSKLGKFNCKFTNHSNDFSLIAIQGPQSEKICQELGLMGEEDFPYYSILEKNIKNEKIILARTGYTGEDGFEVFCSHDFAKNLWSNFLKAGAKPCGLASRDVLRLEVCYPLYGHELNDSVTPLDAGLQWTVKLNKDNFIGKSTLLDYQPKFRLMKFSLERGIPREGYTILNSKNLEIGKVTSGTMSVITGKGIAMALVEKSLIPEDKKYFVNIRNTNYEASTHSKSFVTGGHK
jgi:aminomethyltransferase